MKCGCKKSKSRPKKKIKSLSNKQSDKRVKQLHAQGYETKEVLDENGDILVLKRKKQK